MYISKLPIYKNEINKNCYRIKINKKQLIKNDLLSSNLLKKGNLIKHKEDNLSGKIKETTDKYILIEWKDRTVERIKLSAFNQNDYEITVNPEKVKQLEQKKLEKKRLEEINTAEDLVKLALQKNMFDPSEYEIELAKVTSYDKSTFEKYKNEVINYQLNGTVTSMNDEDDNNNYQGLSPEEIEAQKMLHQIKKDRGLGSFIQQSNNYADSRSLTDIKTDTITFNDIKAGKKIQKSISFEENLQNLFQDNNINEFNDDIINKHNTEENNELLKEFMNNDELIDNLSKINDPSINNPSIDNYSINDNNSFIDDQLVNNYSTNSIDENVIDNLSVNNDITSSNNQLSNQSNLDLDTLLEQINNDQQTKTANLTDAQKSFLSTPLSGLTRPLMLGKNDNFGPNHVFHELFNVDNWSTIGRK